MSDASGTLARPLQVVATTGIERDAVDQAVAMIARVASEEDGLTLVVVGLPRRLDGSPSDMTPRVETFGERLRQRLDVPVVFQDERLSSREAESRLAVREKDWRVRKRKLDAAAAAVILQDHLDARPRDPGWSDPEAEPY